jgi:hypothetical protein
VGWDMDCGPAHRVPLPLRIGDVRLSGKINNLLHENKRHSVLGNPLSKKGKEIAKKLKIFKKIDKIIIML